jgi:hypothetical protein
VVERGVAVGQEADSDGLFAVLVGVGGEGEYGGAGAVGPVAAGVVGDDHERLPCIRGPVLDRHGRLRGLQRGEVGAQPGGELVGDRA